MLEPLLLKVWTIIFVFKKKTYIPQEIKTLIAGTHFSIPLIPLEWPQILHHNKL